jgi:hypothetical protein
MKSYEAKKIIADEGLHRVNWYDEENLRENQVGIKLDNGEWIIYVTDERASVVLGSISKFSSEEEALDVLIRKARYGKKNFG